VSVTTKRRVSGVRLPPLKYFHHGDPHEVSGLCGPMFWGTRIHESNFQGAENAPRGRPPKPRGVTSRRHADPQDLTVGCQIPDLGAQKCHQKSTSKGHPLFSHTFQTGEPYHKARHPTLGENILSNVFGVVPEALRAIMGQKSPDSQIWSEVYVVPDSNKTSELTLRARRRRRRARCILLFLFLYN
jgi:hypothetical protein